MVLSVFSEALYFGNFVSFCTLQLEPPKGIARHEYKQDWKFLTLWDGYGLCEATWEPKFAFVQPDGSINPIFRSYLVENNEGQPLTRTETLSLRKKKNESPCAYLFTVPNGT